MCGSTFLLVIILVKNNDIFGLLALIFFILLKGYFSLASRFHKR